MTLPGLEKEIKEGNENGTIQKYYRDAKKIHVNIPFCEVSNICLFILRVGMVGTMGKL